MEAPAAPGLIAPHMRLGVLCDHALVSQDGKLSLIGIFDRIAVPGLPIQHPRFFVVAVFDMAPGNHTVRVELLDPTGHSVLQEQGVEIPVSVAAAGQSGNLVAELNLLPLEFAGRYDFNLYVGDDRVGVITLTVEVGTPPGYMSGQQQMGQA
jgi:hypothetical protein